MGVPYVPIREIKSNYILIFKYLDPLIFPIREQGPKKGLSLLPKYLSKTCMDENSGRTPTAANP